MSLTVQGIHHCSIVVSDVEAARQFYGEILGLPEIPRPKTFDFLVYWFDLGAQQIHLIPRNRAEPASPRHFALQVADIEAARRHFLERGIACRVPTPIPGAERFFVADPDDNLIEIIQWARPYNPTTDGATGAAVTTDPAAERFEPGLMQVGNALGRLG